MKKTILALLVLLTAALVFTGCPKEPDMPKTPATPNLDGTWLYSESDDLNGALEEPITFPVTKCEITGNTVKSYLVTEAGVGDYMAWVMADDGSDAPTDIWDEPDTGTLTVSGKTITFSFDDDSQTATLADDNKSFTVENEDGESMVFVKQ